MSVIIGICDDSPEQVNLLEAYVGTVLAEGEYRVIRDTAPEDFLDSLKTDPPQLVFLDVDMPGMDGIKLGEEIRAIASCAVLVYITGHEEFAYQAFQVRAFHYLLKPVSFEKFSGILREALAGIKADRYAAPEKTFSVQLRGEMHSLRYSDLLYFEKIGHKIKIHTIESDIFYYGQLYDLMKELEPSLFVRCHQGFIVNLDKIRSFKENTLFLEGNISLPVGKTYTETVRGKLADFLFAGKETL